MEESNLLVWIKCSFHWDESQTLWLIVSLGNLWSGERFLKGSKGKKYGRLCWTHRNKNQHIHPNPLSGSWSPRSSACLPMSTHRLAHLPRSSFPPNGTGGRYISTNSSTLGTFGDFSLLSWYPLGSHSSRSYFLLVCGWRKLCLCEHVTKPYLCAHTLSL